MIDITSPLLDALNLQPADEPRINALIAAKTKAILRYINRDILQANYDKVRHLKGGSIFLTAFPVQYVSRVLVDHATAFTPVCTDSNARITITDTGLILSSGATVTTINFGSNTISQLATAVDNVSNWSIIGLTTTYATQLATDMVVGKTQRQGTPLNMWIDNYNYTVDRGTGIVKIGEYCEGFGLGINPMNPYAYDGEFEYPNAFDNPRTLRVARVQWMGGYETYPDDLQAVCADLVIADWRPDQGKLKIRERQDLYQIEYSPINLDQLPLSNRRILDAYKDRIC